MSISTNDLMTKGVILSLDSNVPFFTAVEDFKKKIILEALKSSRSVAEASRLLQLNRTTVVEMLKRYGINPDSYLFCERRKR